MEETTLPPTQPTTKSAPAAPGSAPANATRSLVSRLTPRAEARVQLILASLMWLVGASILGVRGVVYLSQAHWAAWLIALALVLGVAKGHLILERVARKGVARIRERGRDYCMFGFFSWKTWLLIGVMMGGGILLRESGIPPAILGVLYLAVGTALLYGDRTYWQAILAR